MLYILFFPGRILLIFCGNLWQFYLACGIGILSGCKYSITRSLLSKCVEPQETGKMFSVVAIVSALVLLLANPILRKIYNWSLPFFPGAVMVVSACILGISALLSFYLYTQRHRLLITKPDFKDDNTTITLWCDE